MDFSKLMLIALVRLATLFVETASSADNLGTEFVIAFMRNEVEQPLNVPLELFITTPRTIPVQVRITTPGFTQASIDVRTTVVSGQVEKIELSHLLRLDWVGVEQKVVYVHADNEVVVYALNKERYSTDGFLVYPMDVVGYEYYTVSHSPTNSFSVFALASKYADTRVSITFPQRSPGSNAIRIEYNGIVYSNGDMMNITLDAFQALQCLSYDQADLTGTYITSSFPIAVFSGNVRTWVGPQTSRDHLAIQLPPVAAYGMQFPIIPTPARTIGDIVRVISSQSDTRLFVEGPPPRYYDMIQAGDYVDFVIASNESSTVTADKPVLVVQIVQSQQSSNEKADPSMSVVTARSQYMSDYVFSTPQYYSGGSYDNWLMLAVVNEDRNGLMFDNQPFSRLNPSWTPIPGTVLVGTQVQIEEGPHSVRHVSPVAKFSGYLYGMADKESYSFQIGTRMALINQPCIPTESVFGDGVDNDCDGDIDEELCTGANIGIDTDFDGAVDEDCAINREISAGVPDSGGRQFVIFFMDNLVEAPRHLPLEVYVTPLRTPTAMVQIESPRWFEPTIWQTAEVEFGRVKRFDIPYNMRETGTAMTSKALFVTSDYDIAVYAVNKEQYSADAFLALPIDVLGKEYYAVTHWPNSDSSKCQIGIIGVSDGTRVDVTLPRHANRGTVQVEYDGQTYQAGDTLTVVMDRYSTLQLQSQGDLSGTHVKSTQRVAVMSGNIRTSVGQGSSRDHLVAMLPPTELWGKVYCTVPIPGRSTGDYFYITAAENNTHVDIATKYIFTLDASESREIILSSMEHVKISSDKPILVTQLSQSQQSISEPGDPTMIVLPSVEQWANAYTFSTTSIQNSDTQATYSNFIVMVCHKDKVEGLIIDGKFLPDLFTTWYPVAGSNYTGTSFMIDQGAHTVQHIDPTVTFSVVVYGNADKESYGFAAGMRLARINAPCERTVSVRGDGIDNDCDGRIDEEICDGDGYTADSDGDGEMDEDCTVYVPLATPPPQLTGSTPPGSVTPQPTYRPGVVMIQGPPGSPGNVGSPGVPGPAGVPGYNGYPGNPGSNGRDGVDGEIGEPGSTGETGGTGGVGATGLSGQLGSTGATGVIGPQGQQGVQGATGLKGDRGLSIVGEPGGNGLPGYLGPTGMTGSTGSTGATGARGSAGDQGVAGLHGNKGEPGLKGDPGPAYEDVDECMSGDNSCSHVCVNTIGSYLCSCEEGFRLDESGLTCVDLDECSVYNAGCTDKCMNTAGGFTCSCSLLGFTLAADNRTCIDMDECSLPAYNCTTTQTCVNTMGSYLCIDSLPSLFLVGSDEAADEPGRQTDIADCPVGEQENADGTCVDLNECSANNGGCVEVCTNMVGSYYCSCPVGYHLAQDGQSCADNDECSIGNNLCTDLEICINSVGSYHCFSSSGCEVSIDIANRGALGGAVDTSELLNGDIMLGLLIWLIVLSVMFLFVAACSCKQCRDQDKEKRNHMYHIQDIYRSLPNSPRNIPYTELESNNNYMGSRNGSAHETLSYT